MSENKNEAMMSDKTIYELCCHCLGGLSFDELRRRYAEMYERNEETVEELKRANAQFADARKPREPSDAVKSRIAELEEEVRRLRVELQREDDMSESVIKVTIEKIVDDDELLVPKSRQPVEEGVVQLLRQLEAEGLANPSVALYANDAVLIVNGRHFTGRTVAECVASARKALQQKGSTA